MPSNAFVILYIVEKVGSCFITYIFNYCLTTMFTANLLPSHD